MRYHHLRILIKHRFHRNKQTNQTEITFLAPQWQPVLITPGWPKVVEWWFSYVVGLLSNFSFSGRHNHYFRTNPSLKSQGTVSFILGKLLIKVVFKCSVFSHLLIKTLWGLSNYVNHNNNLMTHYHHNLGKKYYN